MSNGNDKVVNLELVQKREQNQQALDHWAEQNRLYRNAHERSIRCDRARAMRRNYDRTPLARMP